MEVFHNTNEHKQNGAVGSNVNKGNFTGSYSETFISGPQTVPPKSGPITQVDP